MLPILELLGLSKEDAKDIPERIKKAVELFEKAAKDVEAIRSLHEANNALLQDILEELKKRGEK
jgi:hypothetical protein